MMDDLIHPDVERRARRELAHWLETAEDHAARIEGAYSSDAASTAGADYVFKGSAKGRQRALRRLRAILETAGARWAGIIGEPATDLI